MLAVPPAADATDTSEPEGPAACSMQGPCAPGTPTWNLPPASVVPVPLPCRHLTSTAALAIGAPIAAVPVTVISGGVPPLPPPPPPPQAERNRASTQGTRKFRI